MAGLDSRAHVEPGRTKQAETKGAGPGLATSRTREASAGIADTVRDLFQVVAKPAPGDGADRSWLGSSPQNASDPYAELVQGMTLNATLLQGRTQIAVINGRIYNAGQHLGDRDGQPSPLALTKVFANKVILEAGGKHYVLAYPDNFDTPVAARGAQRAPQDPAGLQDLDPQLALIQALLRSPLGGLGARILGKGGRDLVSNADAQLGGPVQGRHLQRSRPQTRMDRADRAPLLARDGPVGLAS